jgi:hypothetical protein
MTAVVILRWEYVIAAVGKYYASITLTALGAFALFMFTASVLIANGLLRGHTAASRRTSRIAMAMKIQVRFKAWSQEYVGYSDPWEEMYGFVRTFDSTLEQLASELKPMLKLMRHSFPADSELPEIANDFAALISSTFEAFKGVGFDVSSVKGENGETMAGSTNRLLAYEAFRSQVAFTVAFAQGRMVNALDRLARKDQG